MTRKDSEKDPERPHYYSQFWLDVAAGRKVIGAPKPEDGAEQTEMPEPEPTPLRKAGRSSIAPVADGHKVTRAPSVVEPEYAPEEFDELEEEQEFELAHDVDDMELPNIVVEDDLEEPAIADLDLTPEEEEEEEDLYFEDEEEEEEEDEDEEGWGARGRKKPKPGRQVKPPKPPKKKREPRRGF